LTVEEARKIANCSQQTIYKLCESGELPACNLGSRKRREWRIEEEVLVKWMREGGVR
jgi:excisionase family DNA binding protein